MVPWDVFPVLPGETGRDPWSSHSGRSFVGRCSPEAHHLSALAPPRERRLLAASGIRSLVRGAAWTRLDVGAQAGEPRSPLAALPDLSTSCPPGELQRVWRPCCTSGLFPVCEGLIGAGGCLVPTENPKGAVAEPCLWPGRGGAVERGALGAQTPLREEFRALGAGSPSPIEQPAWRETPPWLRRGQGLLSPDWWTEGAYHRRLPLPKQFAGFHLISAPEPPLISIFVARKITLLLPLIGFVLVEGEIGFPLYFSFFLPFNCEPSLNPQGEKVRQLIKNYSCACEFALGLTAWCPLSPFPSPTSSVRRS